MVQWAVGNHWEYVPADALMARRETAVAAFKFMATNFRGMGSSEIV